MFLSSSSLGCAAPQGGSAEEHATQEGGTVGRLCHWEMEEAWWDEEVEEGAPEPRRRPPGRTHRWGVDEDAAIPWRLSRRSHRCHAIALLSPCRAPSHPSWSWVGAPEASGVPPEHASRAPSWRPWLPPPSPCRSTMFVAHPRGCVH
nr:unnamed protein product [Digitaria exilis]